MLSFDEQVAPELSSLEPFLPTGPRPSSSVPRKPDPLTVQRLAPPSHVASGLLTTEDAEAFAAAAAADLVRFLGPTDKTSAFVLPEQMQSMTDLAPMAGRLRRNARHFSGALGADQWVLRAAEKVDANLEVMKRERLRDHRGKALGTTSLTISSVVVAIALLITFFVIRFT
ncbi:hypothetical protein EDB83DRAFT_2679095 [Lactarius deliciosus]|nr:hypothetical protein EDB83DRAFT_2679095 [Lactarius deliciosus]